MKIYEKTKNFKFLYFALVTVGVMSVFHDVVVFEICDQVILVIYSLKIKRIKFHGFSMKVTGYVVIFLPRVKKPSPLTPCNLNTVTLNTMQVGRNRSFQVI